MNVVGSSGWLEFFADGPNASLFAEPILDIGNLIVPAVCLYEVFKAVAVRRGTSAAMQAVAHMYGGQHDSRHRHAYRFHALDSGR